VDGLLELPVAFGTIYLGEQFCSYISLGNYSAEDAVDVTVKVLLSCARVSRLTLKQCRWRPTCCGCLQQERLCRRPSCRPTGRPLRCTTTARRRSPALRRASGTTSSLGAALHLSWET